MSTQAKLTLAASIVFATSVIAIVHYDQQREHKVKSAIHWASALWSCPRGPSLPVLVTCPSRPLRLPFPPSLVSQPAVPTRPRLSPCLGFRIPHTAAAFPSARP